jgi:hypothetical protein
MSEPKVILVTMGIGAWYPRGVARLIESLQKHSPQYPIRAWVDEYPKSAPGPVILDGYDYGPYCAKPCALWEAWQESQADIAIWIDAAFYAIRDVRPLVEHVQQTGYYLCDNGAPLDEWVSDKALASWSYDRSDVAGKNEVSSYCVGFRMIPGELPKVCAAAWRDEGVLGRRGAIPGRHTAQGHNGRNVGFVSHDFRVKGHRHDQTALSVYAHALSLTNLVQRPKFTAYFGSETEETVLVNHGGI